MHEPNAGIWNQKSAQVKMENIIKGTLDEISSDPLLKKWHVLFTAVPYKPLVFLS